MCWLLPIPSNSSLTEYQAVIQVIGGTREHAESSEGLEGVGTPRLDRPGRAHRRSLWEGDDLQRTQVEVAPFVGLAAAGPDAHVELASCRVELDACHLSRRDRPVEDVGPAFLARGGQADP